MGPVEIRMRGLGLYHDRKLLLFEDDRLVDGSVLKAQGSSKLHVEGQQRRFPVQA